MEEMVNALNNSRRNKSRVFPLSAFGAFFPQPRTRNQRNIAERDRESEGKNEMNKALATSDTFEMNSAMKFAIA